MIEDKPLVSILCPVYGVENYIGECLESLFNQTYSNLEYVFVNDCTPDRSMEILKDKMEEFGVSDKVTIINNEKNIGLAAVRIECIKAAKGDYITIVDTDDKLSLNAIEKYVESALENDADIVESNYYMFSSIGQSVYSRIITNNKDAIVCSQIALKTSVALWSKLYRRCLFNNVDELFIVGSKNIEDYYATPVLYDKANKISQITEPLYYYRIDNVQSGSRNKKWDKIASLNLAVKHHEDYFKKNPGSDYINALNDVKFYIIKSNYTKLSKDDNTRLSKCFLEIDDYVKEKNISDRFVWWMIRNDKQSMYLFFIRLKHVFYDRNKKDM